MDVITANSNPRVKRLVKLNKDAAFRKQENVFTVEGIRMFKELPAERTREIYMSQSAYERYGQNISDGDNQAAAFINNIKNSGRLTLLSDSVFKTVSQTRTPQGIMAVVERFDYSLDNISLLQSRKNSDSLYLILESVQDPGNLGTILRTAEATGVTCLIIGGESCDIYNPKVIRSTMGAIFRVPFVYTENLPDTIDMLKENDVTIYGAHLSGNNIYDEKLDSRAAFLIGNEGNGLSEEISRKADRLIKIPMEGQVESLNAAVSASLLCYEVLRQRKYD